MRASAAPDRPSTFVPSIAYEPFVGESRQPMIAMSVDLPEPEGPTRATNSPAETVRSMPQSACTAMPFDPKTFVNPCVSMIGRMSVVVVLLDLLLRRVLERDLLATLEARQDLDALERRDAGGDGDGLVVVLPVVREPHVLATPVEPLLGRGEKLRLEIALEAVGDGLPVGALKRLERNRDGLLAFLAEDLDVRAHARAVRVAELVERDLDREDLDLVLQLGGGGHEAHLPREDPLRICVERDPHGLSDFHLRDVDLVQIDPDEECLEVGHREEDGSRVERGHAGRDGLAQLDTLRDDDAGHRARHARALRQRIAGDRDAVALDDLVALLGGLDVLGREIALRDEVLEGLAPDEALLEEALLGRELAFGVLQRDFGLRDAGPHVGKGLSLRDVGLHFGKDVSGFHDGAVANLERNDAARYDGLHVHLGLGLDDADLANAHLEIFRLHLSHPERRGLGFLAFVFAAGGEEDASSREQEHAGGRQDPFELLRHTRPLDGIYGGWARKFAGGSLSLPASTIPGWTRRGYGSAWPRRGGSW